VAKQWMLFLLIVLLHVESVQAGGVVGSGAPASCTEAALDAALAGGGDVSFNCGAAPHTIPIAFPMELDADTRIDGGGLITLNGGGGIRLFRVFGVALELTGLTLEDGFADGHDGGAIYNSGGTVSISNSHIRRNRASWSGGAIFNDGGSVHVEQSTFNLNRALSYDGGAIFNRNGEVTIVDSTFYGNMSGLRGGVIANGGMNRTTTPQEADGGPLSISGSRFFINAARIEGGVLFSQAASAHTITDSQFMVNVATNGAGAILHRPGKDITAGTSQLHIANSRFLTNIAIRGGALVNIAAETTIEASLFQGNYGRSVGGAIANYLWAGIRGRVSVVDTTFRNNRSYYGGAVTNLYGAMEINNTLFEGNYAGVGGGLYNGEPPAMLVENGTGRLRVNNVTFSGNFASQEGGGLANVDAFGFNELTYSTFALNRSPSGSSLAGGALNGGKLILYAFGNSLNCTQPLQRAFASIQFPDDSCASVPPVDPMLASLADNGGPTLTHALRDGSPAIDAVPSVAGTGRLCDEIIDQRHFVRPANGSGIAFPLCDIGAYEYRAEEPTTVTFPLVNATPAPTLPAVPTQVSTEIPPTATPSRTPPPPPQVDCQTFRATSPRDGFPNGETTFYWDPAPGATEYRVSITNERGELVAGFTVAAPATHLSADVSAGAIGGGFSFTWEVQALLNGQPMCRDLVQLFRESPPGQPGGSSGSDDDEPDNEPQCGNGVLDPGESPNDCPNGI